MKMKAKLKHCMCILAMLSALVFTNGCTKIESIDPVSGPPGTPVWMQCSGLWGETGNYCVKLDGKTICKEFPGSIKIPETCEPGKHKLTIIDNLDLTEASLIFPIFRIRHDSVTFTVIDEYSIAQAE